MKRLLVLAAFVAASAGLASAQAVNTTVCDVLKNPAAFNGKTVTIKGTVVAGFDQFVLTDGACAEDVNGIWLAYPRGSKAKAGPLVSVELLPAKNFAGTVEGANRAAVTLTRDKEFKKFDSALSSWRSFTGVMCLGCAKNTVEATITGRLDGVKSGLVARKDGKIVGLGGFGNLNAYPARLVIASVTGVTPKEVDYSKTEDAVKALQKNQDQQGAGGPQQTDESSLSYKDAIASATKLLSQMAPSPLTAQIRKDLATLGKEDENNGILIGFGTANDVSAGEDAPGAVDSPDGVLYNVTFNRDKLPGQAMTAAVLHVAQHITDVRTPTAGNEQAPLFYRENNAWAVTVTMAIFDRAQVVTLSGGNLVWNLGWPRADEVSNMQTALAGFLSKEEMLNK